MDRIIEKSDLGWWIVSHEQKLWLPAGEIPYGAAEAFDLVGQPALKIGEWQGEPVWLIQQPRRQDMGSVRQVLDLKPKELLQRRYERLQSYGRFSDTKER